MCFKFRLINLILIGIIINFCVASIGLASSKSEAIEDLFKSLGGSSDEISQALWKGAKYIDELKKVAKQSGGDLSSKALAKKLNRAGDKDFIEKLKLLTPAERKVFSEVAEIAGPYLKNNPGKAVSIFNDLGVEGVYRSRAMGKNSDLFFKGIEKEGREFIAVLDKGGPTAVRFYHDELLPRKGLPGFDEELKKFLKSPHHYLDSLGKPTKSSIKLLEKFKLPWHKHPKIKRIIDAAKTATFAVVGYIAAGVAGFLNTIPLLAGLAAHSVAIAWGILVIILGLILKVLKMIWRLLKPKATQEKIFVLNNADHSTVTVIDDDSNLRTHREPSTSVKHPSKQTSRYSPVYNWPVVPDNGKGIIEIGIIGARAAGKSTFILMLIETFKKKISEGISLQPDPDHKKTRAKINEYRNEMERYGHVKSTLEHIRLQFSFRRGNSESYRFALTDYPGEDLKPKEEISKEIGTYKKWFQKKDGLIVLVDPLREDERECCRNTGAGSNRTIVQQEEIIPFIFENLREKNNSYPKPVICVLTKIDQLPEEERNLPVHELIETKFPHIYAQLKSFAPYHECFAISSTGGIEPDLNEDHPPVLSQYKPEGLEKPLFWLLEEMPGRCFDIVKANNKKCSRNTRKHTLQNFISRYQSADVVDGATSLLRRLKIQQRVFTCLKVCLVLIICFGGLKFYKVEQNRMELNQLQNDFAHAEQLAIENDYEDALGKIAELQNKVTGHPELKNKISVARSEWATRLLSEQFTELNDLSITEPQNFSQILLSIDSFKITDEKWGKFVSNGSYKKELAAIRDRANDEKIWQEEVKSCIDDINHSQIKKYQRIVLYLNSTTQSNHIADATEIKNKIRLYLKDNLVKDLKPDFNKAINNGEFDTARDLLSTARRLSIEFNTTSGQRNKLDQFETGLLNLEKKFALKTILAKIEKLKQDGKWREAVHLLQNEIKKADGSIASDLETHKVSFIEGYKNFVLAEVSNFRTDSNYDEAINICKNFLSTPLHDTEISGQLRMLQVDRKDYKAGARYRTIMADVGRYKSLGQWDKAIYRLQEEIQKADTSLLPILTKSRDDLVLSYKKFVLAKSREYKMKSDFDTAIRICNAYLSIPLDDEDIRRRIESLEIQRDDALFSELESSLSNSDFSNDIDKINTFIAEIKQKNQSPRFLVKANNLKISQLKRWAQSDYNQIYDNWYSPAWFSQLDNTAVLIRDYLDRPFARDLGDACPYRDSVIRASDWYNELQTEQDYWVASISINNLTGELENADPKIEITIGNAHRIEVAADNIKKDIHKFSGLSKKFKWKPGDPISCRVYEVDWKRDDKFLKYDSPSKKKYSLLEIIDKGVRTSKWEEDPKINERSYPVIKISVKKDNRVFARPEMEQPRGSI